jgi:hypothetical protein
MASRARKALDLAIDEKSFQAAVVEMAQRLGWLVYHTYDSRRSEAGFPDLTMVRGGRLVFAELKGAKDVLSAEQFVWLTKLQACRTTFVGAGAAGPEVYVWRPSDMDAIEAVLR